MLWSRPGGAIRGRTLGDSCWVYIIGFGFVEMLEVGERRGARPPAAARRSTSSLLSRRWSHCAERGRESRCTDTALSPFVYGVGGAHPFIRALLNMCEPQSAIWTLSIRIRGDCFGCAASRHGHAPATQGTSTTLPTSGPRRGYATPPQAMPPASLPWHHGEGAIASCS